MINRLDFFAKYRVDKKKFETCGLHWDKLVAIATDYSGCCSEIEPTANYIAECLRKVEAVHSLKIRLKDPEHLIEKIIRKKMADSTSEDISVENYKTKITDLIGIRALHLFKEDWIQIHDSIMGKWKLLENPIANVRKGDSESILKEKGCEIREHEFGYRSVHYLVQSQPTKNVHIAEIQVRTIFEEGWSEIDHRIRYPYDMDNPILSQYLSIFNRLAGSADEMGSFVKFLKDNLEKVSQKARESDKAISELREQVGQLKIEKKEKDRLKTQIETLSKSSSFIFGVSTQPLSGLLGLSEHGLILSTTPKCSKCGKDIAEPSYMLTYPPLCSLCRTIGYTTLQK